MSQVPCRKQCALAMLATRLKPSHWTGQVATAKSVLKTLGICIWEMQNATHAHLRSKMRPCRVHGSTNKAKVMEQIMSDA